MKDIIGNPEYDPVITDPENYKVVFENEKVRILDYKDEPGTKTHQHRHPEFILYALSSFERKILLPRDKYILRKFKKGDFIHSDKQTHIGENVGITDTHALLIELK